MAEKEIIVKVKDMTDELEKDAKNILLKALELFKSNSEIANYLKKEFDRKYNPDWHCIIGNSFGSFVSHESHYLIYFQIESTGYLLFKTP